ncbi:AfsR family transcriptional regulator, partial [Streptomyces scabiei]|nr:AfsR family transcriptional regulator [Streptomyces scabiei]
AARAAARPDIPLTALADELRRTRASLDAFAAPSRGSAAPTDPAGHGREPGTDPGAPPDLRTVFARSYRRLPPESARLFRLLARHPGPGLTPDAAAALAGLPARRARLLLDGLADAHLVTERAPGRYAQHELLRVFAAELAAAHGHGAGPETP